MKTFLDQLRVCLSRYLKDHQTTPYRVAKKSGMSPEQLYAFRNNKRGLSMESLDKLAAAIGARVALAPTQEH